jgi:hypothetical protein
MEIPLLSLMNYFELHRKAKYGIITKKVNKIIGKTIHLYYSLIKIAGSPIPTRDV